MVVLVAGTWSPPMTMALGNWAATASALASDSRKARPRGDSPCRSTSSTAGLCGVAAEALQQAGTISEVEAWDQRTSRRVGAHKKWLRVIVVLTWRDAVPIIRAPCHWAGPDALPSTPW